jgi:hypothetical protein
MIRVQNVRDNVGHASTQYRARHHFPQDTNEQNIVVLKFQTYL